MRVVQVSEAARLLGVSVDTVRRRVKAGSLGSSHDVHGRMLVQLPDAVDDVPIGTSASGSTQVELEHARQLLAEVRGRCVALEGECAALARQVERAETRLDHAEEERSELRVLLLRQSEQMARMLPAPADTVLPMGDNPEPTHAEAPPEPKPERRHWWHALVWG